MRSIAVILFACAQAVAQLSPTHNNFYSKLSDEEAIAIFKDFLFTHGISGTCHEIGGQDLPVNWKFIDYQGGLVAQPTNDTFISKTGKSFRATIGPGGYLRIWGPKHQVYYWLALRQLFDEYKVEVTSSGRLDFYTETELGFDTAGSCSGKKGDLGIGKPEKKWAVKANPEEPPPRPVLPRPKITKTAYAALKLCPLEGEVAKNYLLENDLRIVAPHDYRESDVPQVVDLMFRERDGRVFAMTKELQFSHQLVQLLEGAHNASLFPVTIGKCDGEGYNEGQGCPIEIKFPRHKVTYTMTVFDRLGERPPNVEWDCRGESDAKDFLFKMPKYSMNCKIGILQHEDSAQKPVTVLTQKLKTPACRLK